MLRPISFLFMLSIVVSCHAKDDKKTAPPPSPWAEWIEPEFPFFSSVLDARDLGEGWPKDNLTPRGLVLNLGHNLWACFDTDLLRMALIWQGEEGKPPITPVALATGSYHVAGQKTKDGQEFLPQPTGKPWVANGIYPGWQVGEKAVFSDPREPTLSPEEVGRGPLDVKTGRFLSVNHTTEGVVLTYEVGGRVVRERVSALPVLGGNVVVRQISIAAGSQPLVFLAGNSPKARPLVLPDQRSRDAMASLPKDATAAYPDPPLLIKASDAETAFTMVHVDSSEVGVPNDALKKPFPTGGGAHAPLWPETVTTAGKLSTSKEAFVVDEIEIPSSNPWKRNVRLADLAFLNDQGDAVAVAFDGDVWHVSGMKGDLEKLTWKRFASGLHEPMSIVVRKSGAESEIFVYDRDGIWKLRDTNGDGEADAYEMFCNLFSQTAETREFPNSMKLGPDGSLYISKGGQEGTTYGRHNGTVIRVAPDGKTIEVIGYGLRQPFIGVHPKTGLVTASDQQGNYVPSTPIQIVEKNQFYGHVPTIAPKEKYPAPIAEPLVWIPHPVNPSGATQTWLVGAKMGPINDELIHVGYNRPEIFRVLINERFSRPQATVMTFSREFDFGPLNAVVNPADGQLYVIGFQVWGTTAKKLSGISRIRYTGAPRVLLKECTPMDKGVLMRFTEALDPKLATDPSSYSAERWNYRRTAEYGSPHLKLDGTTGQEWMTASSAYLSKDGKSVFVGIPDMKGAVHQMRIGWGLQSKDGHKAENTAYFTPHELAAFDPVKEGFEDIKVDLTPRKAEVVAMAKPTVEEGLRLSNMVGCMACHSIDGTTVGKVGPSWKGIYGSTRELAKKGKAVADEEYLKESILNPSAKVVKGFEKFDTGMPIYAGILNESQVESLILYIKSLK
jgi:cytochrome c2